MVADYIPGALTIADYHSYLHNYPTGSEAGTLLYPFRDMKVLSGGGRVRFHNQTISDSSICSMIQLWLFTLNWETSFAKAIR